MGLLLRFLQSLLGTNKRRNSFSISAKYSVVYSERGSHRQEYQEASLVSHSVKRNQVRALTESISTEMHQVTIKGPCHVQDGDSIFIGDTSIRLHGIDAPELDHPYGKNAKWELIKLCKGQIVSAVLEGSLSHKRIVATCYLPDGRDLSAEMVKLGMAVDWAKFSGGKYRSFEVSGVRRKLWRCDARQKGRMPPPVGPADAPTTE
jgi:micrococcal nuclease